MKTRPTAPRPPHLLPALVSAAGKFGVGSQLSRETGRGEKEGGGRRGGEHTGSQVGERSDQEGGMVRPLGGCLAHPPLSRSCTLDWWTGCKGPTPHPRRVSPAAGLPPGPLKPRSTSSPASPSAPSCLFPRPCRPPPQCSLHNRMLISEPRRGGGQPGRSRPLSFPLWKLAGVGVGVGWRLGERRSPLQPPAAPSGSAPSTPPLNEWWVGVSALGDDRGHRSLGGQILQ